MIPAPLVGQMRNPIPPSDRKRPRIAFVITGLHTGGAEIVLANLIEQLGPRIEAKVFALREEGPIRERIVAAGGEVEHLSITGPWSAFVCTWQLHRALKAFSPDLVHTWMYHADLVGGLAAVAAGIRPIAWGIHNSTLDKDAKLWTRILVRTLASLSTRVPDSIQCCSVAAAAVHVGMGYPQDKIQIIHNGVDCEAFAPSENARLSVREELELPPATPLIGAVGRYHPQKDYPNFLATAGELVAENPDVHFILAGRGLDHDNHELSGLVSALGLGKNMHLLGPRTDIPRIMASLDVYTSSSSSEAFPVVLLEAMSSGVPCVATDVGDSARIIGDSGIVVEPRSPKSLALGLRTLLALPPMERLALGRLARTRILEKYSWPHVSNQFFHYYTDLIEGNA